MSLFRPCSLLLLLLASNQISAMLAPIPRATYNIADGLGFGTSPMPTPPPDVPDLRKRQSSPSGQVLGYYAPDNTCGYIDGDPCTYIATDRYRVNGTASALSCAVTESCAAVVVQGVASMGCCNPGGGCEFFGNCVAYAGFSSGLCDAECQADPNTLKW